MGTRGIVCQHRRVFDSEVEMMKVIDANQVPRECYCSTASGVPHFMMGVANASYTGIQKEKWEDENAAEQVS